MENPYYQKLPQQDPSAQEQPQQEPQYQPYQTPPQEESPYQPKEPGSGKAVASLVLGIVATVLMFLSVFVVPGIIAIVLSLIGIILGVQARRTLPRGATGMATAGMVLSIIALALSVLLTAGCAAFLIHATPYYPYSYQIDW